MHNAMQLRTSFHVAHPTAALVQQLPVSPAMQGFSRMTAHAQHVQLGLPQCLFGPQLGAVTNRVCAVLSRALWDAFKQSDQKVPVKIVSDKLPDLDAAQDKDTKEAVVNRALEVREMHVFDTGLYQALTLIAYDTLPHKFIGCVYRCLHRGYCLQCQHLDACCTGGSK